MTDPCRFVAFVGYDRVAAGSALEVALRLHAVAPTGSPPAVFDTRTGAAVDFDLRGGPDAIAARYAEPPPDGSPTAPGDMAAPGDTGAPGRPPGRGRPKLGVVAREVTLLPRHWDWLAAQPGGASVALRKLVEAARKEGAWAETVRSVRTATSRFMTAMAGDLPGYEAAGRALFADDRSGFEAATAEWPADVRDHARAMASGAFA